MLSSRFDQALQYASLIHGGQRRKGTNIPYVAHLLGVAGIALEHGANEDEAIGALLHDAGEDAGGPRRIEDIRFRFGDAVGDIVLGCTDPVENPKPSWRQRKATRIAELAHAPASVRLVSASDKLHNARSIVRELRAEGPAMWSRFNGGKDGSLWYYRAVVDSFRTAGSNALIDELDRAVTELENVANHSGGK